VSLPGGNGGWEREPEVVGCRENMIFRSRKVRPLDETAWPFQLTCHVVRDISRLLTVTPITSFDKPRLSRNSFIIHRTLQRGQQRRREAAGGEVTLRYPCDFPMRGFSERDLVE